MGTQTSISRKLNQTNVEVLKKDGDLTEQIEKSDTKEILTKCESDQKLEYIPV